MKSIFSINFKFYPINPYLALFNKHRYLLTYYIHISKLKIKHLFTNILIKLNNCIKYMISPFL